MAAPSRHIRLPRVVSATAEVVTWWLVTTGVWLLTLSTITSAELGVALACGLLCGLAARAGRHALAESWRPRPGWVRWLVPLPWAVLADTGRVLVSAVRSIGGDAPSGSIRTITLAPDDREPVRHAHQALATVVLSSAPGTVVLDGDPDRHTLTLHSLVSGPPQMEEVVGR